MKYALAASMMALGLAACGGGASGGDKSALVKKCMEEEGGTKETCNCQIDAIENALGSDDFGKLVKIANKDDAAAEAEAEKLMMEIMSEKPDAAMKMGMAMMACGEG